ncbi:hypothetical protein ACP179_01510 (plasmid) [Xenorhabdus stockiae]|uniref:hypothetical protein n=1 Tax=Xenorhabdus stockiae TaxID=351614 RepID=UPI003CFA274D
MNNVTFPRKLEYKIPDEPFYFVEDMCPVSYEQRLSIVAHGAYGRIFDRSGNAPNRVKNLLISNFKTPRGLADVLEKHFGKDGISKYIRIRLLFCSGAGEIEKADLFGIMAKYLTRKKEPFAATLSKIFPEVVIEAYKGKLHMNGISKIDSTSLDTSPENMHGNLSSIYDNRSLVNANKPSFRTNKPLTTYAPKPPVYIPPESAGIKRKYTYAHTLRRGIEPVFLTSNKDDPKFQAAICKQEETKLIFDPINYFESKGPYFWLNGQEVQQDPRGKSHHYKPISLKNKSDFWM